jgi:hypothetical protein
MKAEFNHEIQFFLTCSVCDNRVVSSRYTIPTRGGQYMPNRPAGWRVLDGNLICDQHEIVVDPDRPTVIHSG